MPNDAFHNSYILRLDMGLGLFSEENLIGILLSVSNWFMFKGRAISFEFTVFMNVYCIL